MYKKDTAVFTNEPALYIYRGERGSLKTKFDIKNYYFVPSKKNTNFELVHMTKKDKSKIPQEDFSEGVGKSSKFKLLFRKSSDVYTHSPSKLIDLLEKYTISNLD
mmetsp:Transcript_27096/g.23954  ORF Transcript_27096/g.23954 Transcript_27096/m.23954 type:complete len:105 (+) Transcript_27096:841-1155(+)